MINLKTKEQIENEFRADLRLLLNKYGAELEIDDKHCSESRSNIRMMVFIQGKYGKDGEQLSEYTEINLGDWVSYKEIVASKAGEVNHVQHP